MLHLRRLIVLVFLTLTSVYAQADFQCVICHKVVNKGFKVQGKFYCQAHLDLALPKCHNCQSSIQGSYVSVSHRELPICLSCRNNLPRCFLCSLPVEKARGGLVLENGGRYLCSDDAKTAVTEPGRARALFRQAQTELKQTFGQVVALAKPIQSVKLVDLEDLKAVSEQSGRNQALIQGKVLGLTSIVFVEQGKDHWLEPATIHLLNYVPESRMLSVAAHEYAHVWHAENHRNYQTTQPILREGFAEWAAYKVNQNLGREDQLKIMVDSGGGVYSDGLLKFLQLEKERGITGVFEFAKNATTI